MGTLFCDICHHGILPAVQRCYRCQRLALGGRTCEHCRHASPLYAVRAVTRYEGAAKELVWRLKFQRARAAADCIACMVHERYGDAIAREVVWIPLPTATNRVRRRGYDQAVLIAQAMVRRFGGQYMAPVVRLGQLQQRTATRRQRLAQLETAFYIPEHAAVRGRHIILIDDVVTTGATLESAARCLKAAGASRVEGLVFAQA